MTTKTTTVRLPKDMLEQIDEKCQEDGCNRNDWIKNALDNQLELESDEGKSQDQEMPKIFDCRDGNLYHNDKFFGKCADYDLNDGKVYDDSGQYLGQINNSDKPRQVVEI